VTVSVGQIIEGKYRIVRLIGQGGMGAVYEGVNQLIDRRVAIKVMLPDIGSAAVGRFEQEARAAGRIGNDHILEILDVGRLPDGSHYMVAEFLDGESLESRLEARGALQPAELAPIALQLLQALGAAHRAGVLHRDLKPDNVFLVREKAGHRDFVKLIDFGISKFAQDSALNLTKTGTMVGTPYYMSPEQARGKGPVDARADLYAVGVILYQAVSGQLPFVADSFNDLLFKIVLEAAPPVTHYAPFLDPAFAAIITRAMAREAADRYQTAEELSEALVSWLRDSGEGAKLPSLAPSYRKASGQSGQGQSGQGQSGQGQSGQGQSGQGQSGRSQGAVPGPQSRAAQTPSPMATVVMDSSSGMPSADTFPYSQKLGRGTTPPTPNNFGRTSAEAYGQPLERPIWQNPILWVALTLTIGLVAFGAFLLAPSAEEPAAATSPTVPLPSEQAHGAAAEPAAPPPAALIQPPAPSSPPPAKAAAEEPAPSTATATPSQGSAPSKRTRQPASTSTPTPAPRPQSPPPSASSEPASKRMYFGY
jgi:serine/threonine protein kinase